MAVDNRVSFTLDVVIQDTRIPTQVTVPADGAQGAWSVHCERFDFTMKSDTTNAPGVMGGFLFGQMPTPELLLHINQPMRCWGPTLQPRAVLARVCPKHLFGIAPDVWTFSMDGGSLLYEMATMPFINNFTLTITDYLERPFTLYSPTDSPDSIYCTYNDPPLATSQPCTPIIIQLKFTPLAEG